jgi:hypothetical protein
VRAAHHDLLTQRASQQAHADQPRTPRSGHDSTVC